MTPRCPKYWFAVVPCLVAVLLLHLLPASWAEDDPDAAIQRLVREVGGRLEYALRLRQTDAVDLKSVRIEYVLSSDGRAAEGASVGLRSADSPAPGEDPFRQVCWPLHPLQGERAYEISRERAGGSDKPPMDMTLSVGWELATAWCEYEPSRLASVIGHELGHVVLGHLVAAPEFGSDALELARLDQEREFAADGLGIELAQAAGYADALSAASDFWRRVATRKGPSTALEPTAALSTHPTILERIAQIQSDPERKRLWRSLVVYDYGTTYLQTGDWLAAQDCFDRALAAFPGSSEVLSDLAYCKMMRYHSSLNETERRRLDGEVSCQAFVTARPPIRGGSETDKTPLREATAHLREVLAARPDYLPARVMLGTTMVMDPDAGVQALQEAAGTLAVATDDAAKAQTAAESSLDRAAAADLFADALANCALARARSCPAKAVEIYLDAWRRAPVEATIPALQLNLVAALVERGDVPQIPDAPEILASYLRTISDQSYYYRAAVLLWSTICPGQPLPRPTQSRWLPTKTVSLGNGRTVFLGSDWALVSQWLRDLDAREIPAGGTDVICDCRELGMQLRASRGVVKCIMLVSPAAPEVLLRGSRASEGPALCLRVGRQGVLIRRGNHDEPAGKEALGDESYRVTLAGRQYTVYRGHQLAIAWDGDTIASIAMLGA